MFGSKLKGMRDIFSRAITCIPCPGRIEHQPQTFSVLRNWRNGPGEKMPATPGPRTAFFFFAVVWIKWMNIFRPAYFTLRHRREGGGGGGGGVLMSLSGHRAEWKESIR